MDRIPSHTHDNAHNSSRDGAKNSNAGNLGRTIFVHGKLDCFTDVLGVTSLLLSAARARFKGQLRSSRVHLTQYRGAQLFAISHKA